MGKILKIRIKKLGLLLLVLEVLMIGIFILVISMIRVHKSDILILEMLLLKVFVPKMLLLEIFVSELNILKVEICYSQMILFMVLSTIYINLLYYIQNLTCQKAITCIYKWFWIRYYSVFLPS